MTYWSWKEEEVIRERLGIGTQSALQYRGKPIILRDTPIIGGVSVGLRQREAITVDPKNDPDLKRFLEEQADLFDNEIGDDVGATTLGLSLSSKIAYNGSNTEEEILRIVDSYNAHKDGEVPLGKFYAAKVGNCRHTALLAGSALEFLIDKKVIDKRSRVSIDRNTNCSTGGRHVWTRFTDAEGTITIVDPAQAYFGHLEASVKRDDTWNYVRPGDLPYLARKGSVSAWAEKGNRAL